MEPQTAVSLVSLVGAAFSTVTTVYYWFVRARGERPNLKAELVEREWFLGAGTAEKRQLGFKLGLVVANGSTLPNAVLGIRLWVKQREGKWLEAEHVVLDKSTPQPCNLPALQTGYIVVNGNLTFPTLQELEQGGNKALVAYADHFLASPRTFRVELKGLNDRRFTNVIT
jgi:hypothetical protein